jgi:hypothetical protein
VALVVDADGGLKVRARDLSTDKQEEIQVTATQANRVKLRDADEAPAGLRPAATLCRSVGVTDEADGFHEFFPPGSLLPASGTRIIPTIKDAQKDIRIVVAERGIDNHEVERRLDQITFREANNEAPAGKVGCEVGLEIDVDGRISIITKTADGRIVRQVKETAHTRLAGRWLDQQSTAADTGPAGAVVFVSHAALNGEAAMRLVSGVEAAGRARCWIAPRDVRPGYDYRAEIMESIKTATHCVVLVTEAANASPHVLREVSLADQYSKRIIPIRIDDVVLRPELEYLLSGLHWVRWETLGDDFSRLI